MVGALFIAAMVAFCPPQAAPAPTAEYYTTTARVTEYCPACNSPAGYGSASGATLTTGHVACGWLPIGTEIEIDGEMYTVVDVCGTDAVDVFVDDGTGVCHCNRNEYEEIRVYGNGEE